MEYIEREAALEAVNFYDEDKIMAIPAADVVPVRHGHFIANTNPFVAPCSECGHTLNRRWHYCPNCGARMDGDEE